MNTENYRTIPNEEYERLVGLANLHEKAIKEVVKDAIDENEKAYDNILKIIGKYNGYNWQIKKQLEDIVDFIQPYYNESYVKGKFIELMDKYIKQYE